MRRALHRWNFSGRRQLRSLIVAGAAVLSSTAWAAVDTATLERAEAMLKEGKAAEVYQLLEPLEVSGAGDLIFDYLLGTAALETGKFSKATFIYERILAVDPSYVGVRADMGRAYYGLGDFARAKIEFETVLSLQTLPPDLRSQVELYNRAIAERAEGKRTIFTAYLELGVGHDTNIGSSTAARSLILPLRTGPFTYEPLPPTGRRTADTYSTVGVGGEVNHQLDEHWSLFAGGDVRWRGYETYHDPNNVSADGRGGVAYSGGSWQLRGSVTGGTYYYLSERNMDNVGMSLDWRLALDNANQLTAGTSLVQRRFVTDASSTGGTQTSSSEDTDTVTGSLGWLTSLDGGSAVFSVSASGGLENAVEGRSEGDKRFLGPRVFVQKSFTPTVGAYVTTGATHSVYERENTSYLKKRREMLYDVGLGVTWSVAKGMSLRPQLSYVKNRSNAELYSYKKGDASVNLRMDF